MCLKSWTFKWFSEVHIYVQNSQNVPQICTLFNYFDFNLAEKVKKASPLIPKHWLRQLFSSLFALPSRVDCLISNTAIKRGEGVITARCPNHFAPYWMPAWIPDPVARGRLHAKTQRSVTGSTKAAGTNRWRCLSRPRTSNCADLWNLTPRTGVSLLKRTWTFQRSG